MAPSITSFSQLLTSGESTFKTLKGVKPIIIDGFPQVIRTTYFAEFGITIEQQKYLLCLPLDGTISASVARTAAALQRIKSAALTEYSVLPSEVSIPNSTGEVSTCDLVLHAIPAGESLDKAVSHIPTSRLVAALDLLEGEMLKAGFLHGNLKPSNLIYGEDGRLYPVRYHYAQVGASSEDITAEIGKIREFIAAHPSIPEVGEEVLPTAYELLLPYDEVFPMQGRMRRIRKGSLYGYLDSNDAEVIEPQYIYAENFFEDRAVVQNPDGKMGVIDHRQHWIIEPIYDMVGFEDGLFDARLGEEWFKIDYSGKTIK